MELATLKTIAQNFCDELTKAAAGKKTSLPFITNPLATKPLVESGELFESLVMGGSNFKKALMRQHNGVLQIFKRRSGNKPPLDTKEQFLEFIESQLDLRINSFGLNFAYPLEPVLDDSKLDGIFKYATKEDKMEGLVGKKVGHEIEAYIYNKLGKKIHVSVANDTIGLLLAGLTIGSWKNLVGGIVGTGINFGFFLDEHTAVNIEAAAFDRFPQTAEGKVIDAKSQAPGKTLFEKETAGKYLYRHFNHIMKQKKQRFQTLESTFELNEVLKSDDRVARETAVDLFDRSAQLVAAQIAGLLLFKKCDLTFVMEGSLFYKARGYRTMIKRTVQDLCLDHTVTFVRVEDSGVVGAAKLVT